jgi:serine/threonine protein kinase
MRAPDEIATDIAGAILDGTAVEWPAVEAQSGDAQRQLLEQLRVLAALADVYRRIPIPSASSSSRSTTVDDLVAVGRWGPLRVLEQIGRGSFGTVYRAWDPRLDREVALKLLPARPVPGNEPATSVEEGRLLARVRHPNVVAIYGAEHIENEIGLWMEFIRGETLEQAVERGRVFSVAEATNIGIELCGAVSAVHGAGLLHRDIKAHNVLLAEDGRAVLMDFGAGRDLADCSSSDFTGTPLYLAPEIFEGQQASARSDIYSLGVVLYHLVTRAYPVPSRSVEEIRGKHERAERMPLLNARPDLPERFVQVIERATAADPQARYGSATAMQAALAATVVNPAHAARRRRRRLALFAGATVLLALTLGLARSTLFQTSFAPPSSRGEWIQITNFADSVIQPAFSPDGRMLTFVRGSNILAGPGQIYVKRLPDGEPEQLTDDRLNKMGPVFSPDGSQIAYTTVDPATFRWDTQVLSIQGTDPPRFLTNASGLTWIDSQRLLFSEIKGGIHMALVTATEGRRDARDVYVPPHERGMAHRSALSPDGNWVIAAEMENQAWLPCRLLPFDGRDRGRAVGPTGAPCTEAAWAPDGAWMYLNVNTDGSFHIWRQRFPDGPPEQVTFGPTEETGLAVAPDGRSLITSVGITTSSIWIHDRRGERQVSIEGSGDLPGLNAAGSMPRGSYFSPGHDKLYYLIRRSDGATRLDGELWAADLVSGRSERVLPGFTIAGFDISDDGARVVFAAANAERKPRLWLASLDGRFPTRQLSETDDDHPLFAPDGEIIFRSSEQGSNFVYRMKPDGTARTKIAPTPILALNSISPDGRWVLAYAPVSGEDVTVATWAYPMAGGPGIRVCDVCKASWSRDGRRWYLTEEDGRTYVIALSKPNDLPDLPVRGIRSAADLANFEVIDVIEKRRVAPGRDESTYAFVQTTVQRNLYRIPLP